jgi:hypothetical protein
MIFQISDKSVSLVSSKNLAKFSWKRPDIDQKAAFVKIAMGQVGRFSA